MLQDNSLSYSEKESPIVFGRALLLQFLFLEILYNDLINRWIYNSSCLYYCKDTLFEAIHNNHCTSNCYLLLFVLLQRYTF